VQRESETIQETINLLKKATAKKGKCKLIVVVTRASSTDESYPKNVYLIPSVASSLSTLLKKADKHLKIA